MAIYCWLGSGNVKYLTKLRNNHFIFACFLKKLLKYEIVSIQSKKFSLVHF